MTRMAEELLEQVMSLGAADRVEVYHRLEAQVGPDATDADPGYADQWEAELRERLAQVERGEVVPVPWRDAMSAIRQGDGRAE